MALPQTEPRFDVDSYLAWEETRPERHEYFAGEVFAMSGGSDAHYTVTLNLASSLKSELSGTPCRPFVSGMKVRIASADAILYPDVFVTCDSRDKVPESALAKAHPLLIAEVLSDSTAAYDRGRKFEIYQKIPELQEYLIIEQDRPHADLFRKSEAGLLVMHPSGAGDTLELHTVGLQRPQADLYADVDIDTTA